MQILCHLPSGTWTSSDFVIHRGPGTNALWIGTNEIILAGMERKNWVQPPFKERQQVAEGNSEVSSMGELGDINATTKMRKQGGFLISAEWTF